MEEITHKTGTFKKFDELVQMLCSALAAESESVHLDVLTYSDLQALKSRRRKPEAEAPASASGATDKRYVILTYSDQRTRVHYPLPLRAEPRIGNNGAPPVAQGTAVPRIDATAIR